MTTRPRPVTGLTASGDLMAIHLTWDAPEHGLLVDHHRVHALPTPQVTRRFLRDPGEETVAARTLYPHADHEGLSPKGEDWTHVVVTVDAAGQESRPTAPVRARSRTSVTTARAVAQMGEFDRRSLEFRHAPDGYKTIPVDHPDGVITVGPEDGPEQWPFLLPGPGDAWAGSRPYTLRWTVRVEEPVSQPAVALWGIDTTRLGSRLEVELGAWQESVDLPAGGTRGSREGDATVPGTALTPFALERTLPDTLPAGEHTLTVRVAEGGWLAWDAAGLFDLS
ncbi:polysaccharide lyase family protein [Kytococcus sp. Marseille-QA3725]